MMKSRVYLPASIAAVGIAAFTLVFCRKSGEEDEKQRTAGIPRRPSAQSIPPAARPALDNSRRIGEKTPGPKTEPDKMLTPAEEEKPAWKKAITMYKGLLTYAMENNGSFPSDTSALLQRNYGFPVEEAGDWLRQVIEYRGRDLTNSDDGRIVIMRYRIGNRTDKEVRVHLSGSVRVAPSTEPLDGDVPPPVEAPR